MSYATAGAATCSCHFDLIHEQCPSITRESCEIVIANSAFGAVSDMTLLVLQSLQQKSLRGVSGVGQVSPMPQLTQSQAMRLDTAAKANFHTSRKLQTASCLDRVNHSSIPCLKCPWSFSETERGCW